MNLPEFSVRNSLLVNLISIFVFLGGVWVVFKLPRDAFPPVNFDIITVSTSYPGAPAEDVEKYVTIPLEKEIKGVSSIKEMSSSSDEGLSLIGVTIDPEAPDKEQVVDDVKKAVDRVRNLPEGVEEAPLVFELKSKERPVLELSISGPYEETLKRQYAQALEDLILDIPGVASVKRIGWRDQEIWVEVFPERLLAYHVSVDEVVDALKTRNVTLPAGQMETFEQEYSIRVTGEFIKAQEISEVIIRANDAGHWLKVKDVARVTENFEDETRIAKINKERAVAMVVVKSERGDVIKLAQKVKKTIQEFQKRLPEKMEATITNDFSYYVKRRLDVVIANGIVGFVLVVLLLFLFMDHIPAIMTALGIPFALFLTFIFMLLSGMSINLVSMLGLIIVLGMLVDDGIIVSENIYRYLEEGLPIREAVIKGTQEMIAPVTGTIVTTWAAFFPLLFMKDILGKFIKEIPIIVIVALAASLLEAFVVLPSHLFELLSRSRQFKQDGPSFRPREKRWFQGVLGAYLKTLSFVLDQRYKFCFLLLLPLFVLSIYVWKAHMKTVLFTDEAIESFFIRAEAPQGTPLTKMNDLIQPVEELVSSLPKIELDAFRTYLGSIEEERGFDPNAKRGTHLGQVTVFLTPYQQRKRSTREIAAALRERLKDIAGFEKLYVYTPKPGPPVGRSVDVAIKGEDFKIIIKIAREVADYLQKMPGVSDVETSFNEGKKQLRVTVNEEKARQYGLTISQIATTVRAVFKGAAATSVKPQKAEEEIDVLVRFPAEERNAQEAFEHIQVYNKDGYLVPLLSCTTIEEEIGIYQINHLDGKRVIHVLADIDPAQTTSLEVNQRLNKEFRRIEERYLGYVLKLGGEFEEQEESAQNLVISFLFALFFIFIILTAEFKSLIEPFIVMLAIPFGLMGVIWAFFLHGKPLSFFGLLGVVGLAGIVVNDSIVLVDFINRLRRSGKERRSSLLEAGRVRLRPVLMTTITTIGGLVSVAYGIGGGDPFLKPLALAMVWGLFFSTAMTLLVIPCVYAILDDAAARFFRRGLA